MNKLCVHIGFHKTATTWLQNLAGGLLKQMDQDTGEKVNLYSREDLSGNLR